MGFLLYGLLVAALLLNIPPDFWGEDVERLILIVLLADALPGGWVVVHALRAIRYRQRSGGPLDIEPRPPDGAARDGLPTTRAQPQGHDEAFVVVMRTKAETGVAVAVYRALISEAIASGSHVTLIVTTPEDAERRLAKAVFRKLEPPPRVRLVFIGGARGRIDRTAVISFRTVSRLMRCRDGAVMIMGDNTLVSRGSIKAALSSMARDPKLGGLVIDEDHRAGRFAATASWHRLLRAERHLIACSLSFSRMAPLSGSSWLALRLSLVTSPGFITQLAAADALDIGHRGRQASLAVALWSWMTRQGWATLYRPDLRAVVMETAAEPFLRTATSSLQRQAHDLRDATRLVGSARDEAGAVLSWYLRITGLLPYFTLLGLLSAGALIAASGIVYLMAFLLWVLASRLLVSLLMVDVRGKPDALLPLLIAWRQLHGTFVRSLFLSHGTGPTGSGRMINGYVS